MVFGSAVVRCVRPERIEVDDDLSLPSADALGEAQAKRSALRSVRQWESGFGPRNA